MKRGFLFGLGSFLVYAVLRQLGYALRGECGLTINGECYASAAVLIPLWVSLIVLAIWRANVAAPDVSWRHAIGGWLIGFCFMPVAFLTLMLAAGAITFLLK